MNHLKMLNNAAAGILWIITSLLITCSITFAQPQPRFDPNEDPMVVVNLSTVDINDVVRILKDWTGKAVVLSPEAHNLRMTIYSPEKMQRSEALKLLYNVVRNYGFIAEVTDNIIYIKPYSYNPGPQIPLFGPNDSLEQVKEKDTIVRKIFRLNYCCPSEMGKILLPLLHSYGYLTADDSRKIIMISDNVGTLMKIEPIIKQFDITPETNSSVIFEIRNRDPNEEKIEFKRLEIKDFNQILSPLTEKKIVLTKEAEGLRIVFYSERSLPKSKVIQLVYKYLKECDFIAEDANNVIYIKPNITKSKAEIPLINDDTKLSELDKDLVVRKVFQLKYLRPSELCPIIGPMLSDNGYSSIDEDVRTILVIDKVICISSIGKQISELDTDTSDLSPDPMVAFNVSDETIGNLIPALINWTGKSVILSRGAINKRITIAAPRIIRRSQAISTVFAAIKAKGIVVEETCDLICIKSSSFGPLDASTILTDDVNLSGLDKDLIVQNTFKLKYYGISQMAQIIEPLLSDNGYLDDGEGLLKVTDKVNSLLNIGKIVNRLDTELKPDTRHRIFEIHNRDPNEMAEILHVILKNKTGNGSSSQQDSNQITLIPVPEKKWIITRAPDEAMKLISDWIVKLDNKNPPDKLKDISLTDIRDKNQVVEKFFYIKHISSQQIAEKIKPLLSNNGYIKTEENTGTVFVIDKVSALLEIEKLIKKSDVPDIPGEDPLVSINLSSIDINRIAQMIADWTGKKVIPSKEAMNLNFMVYTPGKIHRSEALNLLYSAMRENGFIAEIVGEVIYITPYIYEPKPQIPVFGPNDSLEQVKDKDTIVQKTFKLNYCSPSELGNILVPFLNSYGYITAEDSRKTMMISDRAGTLLRIEPIIEQFDTAFETEKWACETIQVKDANVVEAAQKLTEILTEMGIDTAKKISIQPLVQSKQILIFGNKGDRKLAKSLILDLEEQARDKSLAFERVPVIYVDANEVAYSLNQIFNDLTHDYYRRVSVYPIIPSNQILIFGKEEYHNLIKIILKEIDIPLKSLLEKETFQLQFADTKNVVSQLKGLFRCEEMIFLEDSRITSANKPLSSDTVFFSEEPSLRRLIIISSFRNINKIRGLISQWDRQNPDLSKNQDYEVIQVSHIDVNKASDVLSKIALRLETKNIFIQQLIENNLLLLFGDNNLIQSIKKHLKAIDTESLEKAQEYDVIPIKYVEVNEVADSIHTILEDINADYKNKITIVPLSELHLLLFFGDKAYCELIRNLTKELSSGPPLEKKKFSVRYAKPEDVKAGLDVLFDSSITPGTLRAKISIEPFKPSSDLIYMMNYIPQELIVVLAPEKPMNEIEELIEEWDSPVFFQKEQQPDPNDERITPLAGTEKIWILKTGVSVQELEKIVQKIGIKVKNQDYEFIQTAYRKITAEKAAEIFNKIFSKAGVYYRKAIFIDEKNNQLSAYGNGKFRKLILDISKEIDTESFAKTQEYDIITLNYTDVKEVADSLHSILNDLNPEYINKISIIPLPDLHQLLILGSKEYCELIRTVTRECPPIDNSFQRKTFKLKYADIEDIKAKLDELFNSTPSTTNTQNRTPSGITPEGKLTADTVLTTMYPSLHQIVVLASEERMKEIEKMIMEWDSPIAIYETKQVEPNEPK